jgi:hypothetical protein
MVSTVNDSGKPIELCLVTNLLDVPAETIAQGYRYRWTIELFFRWFKQILGMRHLISTKEKGIKMQLYAALIASRLIVLWTGVKANNRTWESTHFYRMGWATLDELERHIAEEKQRQEKAAKKTK